MDQENNKRDCLMRFSEIKRHRFRGMYGSGWPSFQTSFDGFVFGSDGFLSAFLPVPTHLIWPGAVLLCFDFGPYS